MDGLKTLLPYFLPKESSGPLVAIQNNNGRAMSKNTEENLQVLADFLKAREQDIREMRLLQEAELNKLEQLDKKGISKN